MEADEQACEQEQAQAALAERQRKRSFRCGAEMQSVAPAQSPRCASGQPSPAGSATSGVVEASLRREASPDALPKQNAVPTQMDVCKVRQVQPTANHQHDVVAGNQVSEAVPDRRSATKTEPSKVPRAEPAAKRIARAAPPRPPADRSSRQPSKGEAVSQARAKPARQSVGARADTGDRADSVDAPNRETKSNAPTVTVGGEDEPIRCTVGFCGVSDMGFLGEEEEEGGEGCEAAAPAPAPTRPAGRQPSRDSYSSRHSTPEKRGASPVPAPASAAPRQVVRAYSQPPPLRPPALPNNRCESPVNRDRGDYAPPDGCQSPGAASAKSDGNTPAARAQPQAQPWKQKEVGVKSADYYLNLLKAARGTAGKAAPPGKAGQAGSPNLPRKGSEGGGGGAQAWGDGRAAYGDQMRARAKVVEATQKQEEGARYDRGCAVLHRVQQRAAQAPSRSASADSATVGGA